MNSKNNVSEEYNDIPDYSGYCPDCPKCGEVMGYSYSNSEFKCPACNHVMDESNWDYESERDDEKPFVCETCGGPWPNCETSCKMFDK